MASQRKMRQLLFDEIRDTSPPLIAEIQAAAPSRTRHWTRVRYTSA